MKKILFVEDDAFIARIYSQKLTEAGFEVAIAEDGLIAVKRLPEFQPDIVILDLVMPRFSGIDVLKFIRGDSNLKSVRVVVFSNTFLSKVGEQVAAIGVDEMVLKSSATPALLIQTVNRVAQQPPGTPIIPESPAEPPPPPQAQPQPAPPAPPSVKPRPAPPAGSDPEPVYHRESASAFRQRLRRDFFEQIPAICKSIRQVSDSYLEPADSAEHINRLESFTRKIRFLTHMTGMAGCHRITQLSSALEALTFELRDRPNMLNDSVRRTIAATTDLLIEWLHHADQPDEQCLSPTSVLVVEDDAVASRALVFALSRANVKAKGVPDPLQALKRLRQQVYDLILLDINLPGMSGLTLYGHIREISIYHKTPIVFMTSHAEFEERARAMLKSGDDFISKPVLPVELTVKITAHVLKRRLADQNEALKRRSA